MSRHCFPPLSSSPFFSLSFPMPRTPVFRWVNGRPPDQRLLFLFFLFFLFHSQVNGVSEHPFARLNSNWLPPLSLFFFFLPKPGFFWGRGFHRTVSFLFFFFYESRSEKAFLWKQLVGGFFLLFCPTRMDTIRWRVRVRHATSTFFSFPSSFFFFFFLYLFR